MDILLKSILRLTWSGKKFKKTTPLSGTSQRKLPPDAVETLPPANKPQNWNSEDGSEAAGDARHETRSLFLDRFLHHVIPPHDQLLLIFTTVQLLKLLQVVEHKIIDTVLKHKCNKKFPLLKIKPSTLLFSSFSQIVAIPQTNNNNQKTTKNIRN